MFGYDEEWLAVLRSTHSLMSLRPAPVCLPGAHSCACVHMMPYLQALAPMRSILAAPGMTHTSRGGCWPC